MTIEVTHLCNINNSNKSNITNSELMCKETHTASSSTQPTALMLHGCRKLRNIARHDQVSPFTCGLARHFVNMIAVATLGS